MRAVAAYMASRSGQNGREREEIEHRPEMTYGGDMNYGRRNEHSNADSRQYSGNNYHDQPNVEMRRKRDSKGRYMENGTDAGDRRYSRTEAVGHMPYQPDYPIAEPKDGLYDGGGMGFGTRDNDYETRSHYRDQEVKPQSAQVGGTLWMKPNGEDDEGDAELDRVTAERWARGMRNEDSTRPSGPRWSMEELKPMAQKFGIKPDTEEYTEFWVMTNAMYSDYCSVAKKFNITSPEYYGMMALAWMRDKDAMPGKTALYYKYLVKK